MILMEDKPLAPLTTLGVGGAARWYVEAASEEEIVEAAAWARERGAPLFVLGGGSNLLVADAGFDGLVVHVALRGIEASNAGIYRVTAGESWDDCIEQTLKEGCAGLECLAGIPGTVGGTPVQNVGAYGQEVSSLIERVRAFDLRERVFVEFTNAECGFAYRRSRFNTVDRGRFVVTRVDYKLTPGGAATVRYAELQRALAGREASLLEVADVVRQIRQSKGMLLVEGDPDCKSAGSFFKNPVVSEAEFDRIAAVSAASSRKAPPRFPAGVGAEFEGLAKVPAAWLIEQAGFSKGTRLGNAGISSRHTLALVNLGVASAAEILALAGKITTAVEARFGVRLEMEPVRLGG